MDLIQCPACGTDISGDAYSCPKCGKPLRTTPINALAKIILAIIALVTILAIGGWILGGIFSAAMSAHPASDQDRQVGEALNNAERHLQEQWLKSLEEHEKKSQKLIRQIEEHTAKGKALRAKAQASQKPSEAHQLWKEAWREEDIVQSLRKEQDQANREVPGTPQEKRAAARGE
jgi:hypothetical protein